MKTFVKLALGAAVAVMTGFSAMAQTSSPVDDNPNYGATVEERRSNLANLNLLMDAAKARDWDSAANYARMLLANAPAAHVSLYQYGANAYKNRIMKATADQKKVLIDSLMMIYDMRAQYFGDRPVQGTPYILELKANDYAALNGLDGVNVRKYYKDAIDASGDAVKPGLVVSYFQQLVNGHRNKELTDDDLLAAYEQLTPLVDKGTQEERDSFTGLLATSGAANCDVLENTFTKRLAENPGDTGLLKQAFSLMSMAKCESDFYISVGEELYKAEPTSNVAILLAMMFEKRDQFDRAIPYLNEQIEAETDPSAKSDIYVRIAASEIGQKRYSAAAQAARQAIALNSANGPAHFLLANAYVSGRGNCSDLNSIAVVWLAYDEAVRAREALEGDTTGTIESVNALIASCRANFPTTEEVFMYTLQPGASYTVNCGWVSGSTTVKAR
jgi:tetratricopeptide (TPR) repeat protein